jgi:hypothetical protein
MHTSCETKKEKSVGVAASPEHFRSDTFNQFMLCIC